MDARVSVGKAAYYNGVKRFRPKMPQRPSILGRHSSNIFKYDTISFKVNISSQTSLKIIWA